MPSRLKYRRNSNPFWVLVRVPLASADLSRTSSFMRAPSLYCAFSDWLRKIYGCQDRRGPLCGGQRNDKIGAFSEAVALGRNGAAMQYDEILHNTQAQPKAVMRPEFGSLSLSKPLKNIGEVLSRDPGPIVGNGDQDYAVFHQRGDPDFAAGRKSDRVGKKVRKNLPQPPFVTVDVERPAESRYET